MLKGIGIDDPVEFDYMDRPDPARHARAQTHTHTRTRTHTYLLTCFLID